MEIAGKIFALGNSNAIRIPHILMEALGLKSGDPITLEVVGKDELVIRKQCAAPYPSIRELFAGYTGERPQEMESSGAVGRELI